MPIVIGVGVAQGPALGLRNRGAQRLERRQGRRSHLHRKALCQIGEVLCGRPVIVGSAALQVHGIRAAGVVAGAVERGDQIGQAFVDDGLRHAFIAAEPNRNRRMISIAADDVARVGEKQRRILRLHLEILGRHPEIIEDQQTVFVRQIIENLLGILTEPVANDVEIRGAMQAKIGLQARSRDALERIVHPPAAAARRDRYAIDPNGEIRRQRLA